MKEPIIVFSALLIWTVLTLIVCIPIAKYIINKTNKEELAYLVYPCWLILSATAIFLFLL